MSDYAGLLSGISKELNIARGPNEPSLKWMARVIYSAVGQVALASLFDLQEDNTPVSIIHFKRRIELLFCSYLSIYPEVQKVFAITPEKLSSEMYNTLESNGCIYHSPNRISYSAFKCGGNHDIHFLRGAPLNKAVFRSGLGAYLPQQNTTIQNTILSLFNISSTPLADQWKQITRDLVWSATAIPAKAEYLRTAPPFSRGYFSEKPDRDGRISLLRTENDGPYMYFFYRFTNGMISASQVPIWLTDNYEYRKLSNCCLHSLGSLPPAIYHIDGDIVNLQLQYLYPPAEQNMIQLYSWPDVFASPFSGFNRILSKPVFLAIQAEFEKIGYQFIEE